ncbi:MAG TPA: pilus assembly protein TadG-related protein [Solirubrobacteraceae bacterium]
MRLPRRARISRIRATAADEQGAVIVVVAVMLVALLAMAALAIDLSSFFQAQRQAQAAADAGALAGAHDLVAGSGSVTGDATSYAQQNFPGATVTADNTSNPNQVTVTVNAPTPVFFGKLLGLASETVGARAVAGKSASTSCPNPTVGDAACAAIFSRDPSCSPAGLNFQGGGMTISGGVWSDGSTVNGATNVTFSGPLTTGNGTGCGWTGSGGTGLTPQTVLSSPPASWPIDYSVDFPACAGAGCTGPGGTPPFCTDASTSPSWGPTPVTGHIYCAVGTGTASNPLSWNGALSVSVVGQTMQATYVGGTVALHSSSNSTLEPCGYAAAGFNGGTCPGVRAPSTTNYPLIYAVSNVGVGSTSSVAFIDGGNGTVIGDVFAPNGLLYFTGGGTGDIGFLEGYDVTVKGGGLSGDGPSNLYPPGSSPPSVSLLQ